MGSPQDRAVIHPGVPANSPTDPACRDLLNGLAGKPGATVQDAVSAIALGGGGGAVTVIDGGTP